MAPSPIVPVFGLAEPVSSITHLLGALGFLVVAIIILKKGKGNGLRVFALSMFLLSCVFMFSMSGIYHACEPGSATRDLFRRLDHAAIFLLIAGTMTPPQIIVYRSWRRWLGLLAIWSFAFGGVLIKVVWLNSVPEWASLSMYLGMGWFGLFVAFHIWYRFGWHTIGPHTRMLLGGAFAYTIGAVMEFLRWPTPIPGIVGSHEVFHLAVIGGACLHARFVYNIAGGIDAPPLNRRVPGR